MGSTFSSSVEDSRSGGGRYLYIENMKLKTKQLTEFLVSVEKEFPTLEIISVENCQLKTVPNEIGRLKNLKVIQINDNLITDGKVPDAISSLEKLSEIIMRGNKITNIPEIFLVHPKISKLDLEGNQISSFPDFKNLQRKSKLKKVVLKKNFFTEFPTAISKFVNIRILNLEDNRISEIPSSIQLLHSLKELYLGGNKLKNINSIVNRQLKLLRVLDLRSNELSQIPDDITVLNHLKVIELQHNRISKFPIQLAGIHLQSLNLAGNEIKDIPSEIRKFVTLESLMLQENQIEKIPKEISEISNLKILCLEFNRITFLPNEMASMHKLHTLRLHNNSLPIIPSCLMDKNFLYRLIHLSIDYNPLDNGIITWIRKMGALKFLASEDSGKLLQKSSIVKPDEDSKPQKIVKSKSLQSVSTSIENTMRKTKSEFINELENIPTFKLKGVWERFVSSQDFSTKRLEALKILGPDDQWNLLLQYRTQDFMELLKEFEMTGEVSALSQSSPALPGIGAKPQDSPTKLQKSPSSNSVSNIGRIASSDSLNLSSPIRNPSYATSRTLTKKTARFSLSKKSSTSLPSPQEMVVVLNRRQNLVMDLKFIMDHVLAVNPSWAAGFIEHGGILFIINLVEGITMRKKIGETDIEQFIVATELLEALLPLDISNFLMNLRPIPTLTYALVTLSNNQIKESVLRLLINVCKFSPYAGTMLVIDAFDSLRKHRREEFNFLTLIRILKSEAPSHVRGLCISLINAVIENTDDLLARHNIRANFLNMGIAKIIQELRKKHSNISELMDQLDDFDQELKDDYEQLLENVNTANADEIFDLFEEADIKQYLQEIEDRREKGALATEEFDDGKSMNTQDMSFDTVNDDSPISNAIVQKKLFLSSDSETDKSSSESERPTLAKLETTELRALKRGESKLYMNVMKILVINQTSALSVNFNAKTIVQQVIDRITDAFEITNLEEYGIWVPAGRGVPKTPSGNFVTIKSSMGITSTTNPLITMRKRTTSEERSSPLKTSSEGTNLKTSAETQLSAGVWLENNREISSYSLRGEVLCEFKMKPWSVKIRAEIGDVTSTATFQVDPNSLCDQIAKKLMKRFDETDTENYGLFVPDQISLSKLSSSDGNEEMRTKEGIWLQDSKKLLEYGPRIKAVEFQMYWKPKPKLISISFGTSGVQRLYFDSIDTIKKVKETVAKLLVEEHIAADDYGLFRDGEFLNESTTIGKCNLDEETYLDFRLKPKSFSVLLPNEPQEMTMTIDTTKFVSDIIAELCKKKNNLDPALHDLLLIDKRTKPMIIPPFIKLQSQNIPVGATLLLTKKESEKDQPAIYNVNVNIWEEPIEENKIFEPSADKKTNELIAASLNKLIEEVTSAENFDTEYLNTFLLTFGMFTTPDVLYKKLIERYNVPDSIDEKTRGKIRFRVVVFIKHWIEKGFKELQNKPVLKNIIDFIESDVQGAELSALVEPIKKSLVDAMSRKPDDLIFKARDIKMAEQLTFMKIGEEMLAKHLTYDTFKLYSKLNASEFFNQAWNTPKLQHGTPNILGLIDQFNTVSKMIASCLVSEERIRRRVKLWEMFIKTAKILREINNFHLLMAFISGMNNAAVARLKYTKERLPRNIKQIWSSLEEEMQIAGSYKNYRSAVLKSKPPTIPYIGVHLQDLVFIEDGNPNTLGSLINWRKCKYVANIVSLIQLYQSMSYSFEIPNHGEVHYFIEKIPKLTDKELYAKSLLCEPRNATRADIK